MSGYDLITELNTIADWNPGSGSIYPILEDLSKLGLIEVVSKGRRSKQVYSLTRQGTKELAETRKALNRIIYEFASKYNKIRLAMAGLVSTEALSTLTMEIFKSNRMVWNQIVESKELGASDIELKLKEYALLLEGEKDWVDEHLRQFNAPRASPRVKWSKKKQQPGPL